MLRPKQESTKTVQQMEDVNRGLVKIADGGGEVCCKVGEGNVLVL